MSKSDPIDNYHHEAGKGSGRRAGANDSNYAAGWELIYGKKKKDEKSTDLPANSDSNTNIR